MRLKDKISIVTGSAAGLGKVIALAMAEEGARVVVCDVNEQALQTTAKEI